MMTLQGRLRACFNNISTEAADKIDDLERQLANALVRDIHSCHPDCDRVGCVNARLRERVAELERERNDFHMEYRAKYDAETKAQAVRVAALEREVEALRDVVNRIRQWDALDTPDSDGEFWKRMLDTAIMAARSKT